MTTVADADLTTWNRYATSPKYRGSNPFGLLTATSLTRHAITWTFSEAVTYGQYVNGDYWVLDSGSGITVNSVSPSPTGTGTSYRNGSMVNPASASTQGLTGYGYSFDAATTASYPLALTGGDSVVSTESTVDDADGTDVRGHTVNNVHIRVSDASVLTVVSSVPSANAFRPCYVNGTKTEYLTTDMDTSLLGTTALATKPDTAYVDNVATWFARPWLDFKSGWTMRQLHPLNNMPNYGTNMGNAVSEAATLLTLDYSASEKQELLYNFIQFGIDLYGMTQIGTSWIAAGGQGQGRYFPLMLASILFSDAGMETALSTSEFSETTQTYVGVTPSANAGQDFVAYFGTLHGAGSYYENGCTGTGDKDKAPLAKNGDACGYLTCCTSWTWVGQVMVSYIMGQKAAWNDDNFFAYVDRWMGEGLDPQTKSGSILAGDTSAYYITDLWNQERGNY